MAGALHKWLKSLAAGSTVTLPHDGCYTVNEILHINHATGLTIIGNGATLKQTIPGQNGGTDRTECPHHPMLFLTRDTNLSISDLNLTGAFDGHNGGVHCEGYNGIELQGDTGVTLNKLDVSNIQGDGLSLQIPTAVKGNPLNTHINVTNSTWNNIGYDGLSMESADGVTISDDTFSNVHLDAIDFEVDLYSAVFPDPNARIPGYAAQDNILITRCLFKNFGVDWFTSQQGQVPGVQQQNVVLSDNTIDSKSPLMQVSGTPQAKTSTRHQNITLTITGNKMTPPSKVHERRLVHGPQRRLRHDDPKRDGGDDHRQYLPDAAAGRAVPGCCEGEPRQRVDDQGQQLRGGVRRLAPGLEAQHIGDRVREQLRREGRDE